MKWGEGRRAKAPACLSEERRGLLFACSMIIKGWPCLFGRRQILVPFSTMPILSASVPSPTLLQLALPSVYSSNDAHIFSPSVPSPSYLAAGCSLLFHVSGVELEASVGLKDANACILPLL
jgi:hypothetical protein